MKLLVSSDDSGLVKEVIFNRGTDTSKKDGKQPKSIKNFCSEPQITSKTYLLNFADTYLIASRYGGNVSVYEYTNEEIELEDEEMYKLLHSFKLDVDKSDIPIALIALESLESIIVAYESGVVYIINLSDEKFEFKPIPIKVSDEPISTFVQNPYDNGIFAFGGKENDAKIIRLYEKSLNAEVFKTKKVSEAFIPQVIFNAKNVKNDHLDLRVPIWITQILFLQDHPENGYKFITATRYGQLRLYDTTYGRRPTKDYKVCEKPILTLTFGNQQQTEVIVTDTHNLIAKYSLTDIDEKAYKTISASAGEIRKPVPKLLGKFSEGGNTGATFGIATNEELLITGGLDRYVRVFDIVSRELLAKVYIGVEISSVIIVNAEDELTEEELAAETPKIQRKKRRDLALEDKEESDEEELWNQLDERNKKQRTK
ncbi:ribosome biogenesis protein NSA1 [Scheffersomyces amazonensis]|uniref:ribosome biogenesis protein NSA1 n=1 Tax=Scheffersomyces amazonensis TaxID=1078765 RepID=UPI00315D279F